MEDASIAQMCKIHMLGIEGGGGLQDNSTYHQQEEYSWLTETHTTPSNRRSLSFFLCIRTQEEQSVTVSKAIRDCCD